MRTNKIKFQISTIMARAFYEDDELITTKPGYNTEASAELKEQESSHGNISFVQGMGVRTAPFLESHFNALRLRLHDQVSVLSAELGTQQTALANEWRNLRSKAEGLIVDPVFENLPDIVLPALAGSILVSKRALPLRFIVPTLFGGVAFKYRMPESYNNIKSKALDWENETFPEVYKQQTELSAAIASYKGDAKKLTEEAKLDLQRQVHKARAYVAELLSDD